MRAQPRGVASVRLRMPQNFIITLRSLRVRSRGAAAVRARRLLKIITTLRSLCARARSQRVVKKVHAHWAPTTHEILKLARKDRRGTAGRSMQAQTRTYMILSGSLHLHTETTHLQKHDYYVSGSLLHKLNAIT